MNYFEQINQSEHQSLLQEIEDSTRALNVSRRSFLKTLGISSGLVLAVKIPVSNASPMKWAVGAKKDGEFSPSAYLRISPDNTVTVICHRSEMGQGIRTSIPMLIADELGASWESIKVEQALADQKYGSQNTDGSRSIRRFFSPLREAAATARWLLLEAASQQLKVPADQLECKDTFVMKKSGDKKIAFGDLIEAASNLELPPKEKLTFVTDSQSKYVNKSSSVELVDGHGFVTGTALFGADVQLPDMLVAVIARPPVLASKVKSFDEKAAKKVSGVVSVIKMDDLSLPAAFKPLGGVAVLAKNTWAAMEGRKKLNIEWELSEHKSHSSAKQKEALKESAKNADKVLRNFGDADKAIKDAKYTHTSEYYVPALIHAPMEPPMATAHWKDGVMNIWASTQAPQGAQQTVAQLTGVKPENIKVHVTLLGGGFGRKSKADFVAEAAILSQKSNKPVKVFWTREDEIQQGYYHAESYQILHAAWDKQKILAWKHQVSEPPIGSTFAKDTKHIAGEANLGLLDMPYDIPNVICANGAAEAHHRIGWLRSVTNINHAFASCSFIDEIAHKLKQDPKDYLIKAIGKDRHIDLTKQQADYGNYGEDIQLYPIDTSRIKAVIEKVAENSKWGSKRPKNRYLGIAAHRSFVAYVASVVEVEKTSEGKIKLTNVWLVSDSGTIVNLDRVKSQMEGAVVFGISLAFFGKVTFNEGAVQQSNFHDYEIARIKDIPPTHVDVMINDHPPSGVGEPGVPPIAPAICNAIFAATGKRIRELPLNEQNILA
ncbi:MAG: xanthine dehydrogenase family protein molybdopterin-binding subunit [Gammaproteobacteria bacterium]|nr:xanthine dehydrogenase family protein molybdopterin-binding subunit [Gammaproteobacteria bacterium]